MTKTVKTAAQAIVAKLTDAQKTEVVAYHVSGYSEGRSLGVVAGLGFTEQTVRHAALTLLGISPCDF